MSMYVACLVLFLFSQSPFFQKPPKPPKPPKPQI